MTLQETIEWVWEKIMQEQDIVDGWYDESDGEGYVKQQELVDKYGEVLGYLHELEILKEEASTLVNVVIKMAEEYGADEASVSADHKGYKVTVTAKKE